MMRGIVLLSLGVMVYVSAVAVIESRHNSRKRFVELQQTEKQRDRLNEQWGRLQLEQSTWATQARIESLAREKLSMVDPSNKNVRVVFP